MSDWTDNDEFWQRLAPALFSAERLEQAQHEVDDLLALTGIGPGSRVLDLACGPGRHAIEFARRGLVVTGVDRTSSYLQRAEENARAAKLEVEWVQEDMRTFRREGTYDLVVNLFTSFGYFSDEENATVAENALASLKPGAPFVLEMAGKEILASGFWPRRWHPVGDGFLLEHTRISDDWDRLENEWTLIDGDGSRHEHHFDHRLYSGVELKRVLLDASASEVRLFGSLEGDPYDLDAERLVAVAHR